MRARGKRAPAKRNPPGICFQDDNILEFPIWICGGWLARSPDRQQRHSHLILFGPCRAQLLISSRDRHCGPFFSTLSSLLASQISPWTPWRTTCAAAYFCSRFCLALLGDGLCTSLRRGPTKTSMEKLTQYTRGESAPGQFCSQEPPYDLSKKRLLRSRPGLLGLS